MTASTLRASVRAALLGSLAFLLAFGTLAGPADAKKRRAKSKTPYVTKVVPKKVSAGDTLIITGKYFKKGATHQVIFRNRAGGKYVFAKSLSATSKRLVLKVPKEVSGELTTKNGVALTSRFEVRVVASRAGRWSTKRRSPLVIPSPEQKQAGVVGDVDNDGIPDDQDLDNDNDGLSDALEILYKMNPRSVDTDGDGNWDSYEYESGLDLNSRALPYAGKRPWPNPLDPSDADKDFDGDGLTTAQEHKLWQAAGRPFPLNYSDGSKYTGGPVPAPSPDPTGLDRETVKLGGGTPNLRTGLGYLSDDERDFDGDGLSNVAEFSARLTQGYWEEIDEGAYPLRPFADLDPTDPDSDGDGLNDGLDDQDGDGWNNIREQYRDPSAANGYIGYMVNPYNPCLPDWLSPTCARYIPIGLDPFKPFDLDPLPEAPIGWVDGKATPKSPTPGFVP